MRKIVQIDPSSYYSTLHKSLTDGAVAAGMNRLNFYRALQKNGFVPRGGDIFTYLHE